MLNKDRMRIEAVILPDFFAGTHSMPLFRKAAFHLSAAALEQLPRGSRGEIAFAGRSNSGKSSAVNALVARNRLAFVSKTPGRTQLINLYALGGDRYLADLPGYGYAKTSGTQRLAWGPLLEQYLESRAPLRGIALVMDIRHPLTALDRRLLEWYAPVGKPVHVLLTKADKLSRGQALGVLKQVRSELARISSKYSAQMFSSLKKSGIEHAKAVFGEWLEMESRKIARQNKKSPG